MWHSEKCETFKRQGFLRGPQKTGCVPLGDSKITLKSPCFPGEWVSYCRSKLTPELILGFHSPHTHTLLLLLGPHWKSSQRVCSVKLSGLRYYMIVMKSGLMCRCPHPWPGLFFPIFTCYLAKMSLSGRPLISQSRVFLPLLSVCWFYLFLSNTLLTSWLISLWSLQSLSCSSCTPCTGDRAGS